jgi:WhiB family redox-sensing transcriptional regulator
MAQAIDDQMFACLDENSKVNLVVPSHSDGRQFAASHVKRITSVARRCARQHDTGGGIVALMWNRPVEWDTEDWRKVAACKRTEPDLFFPVGTTGPAIDQIEMAKRVCHTCEAIESCLDFALATNQEAGVWGGTSEEERRRLRKSWLAARRRVG